MTPHNGHVVPLFRIETYVLARLAGSLAALPSVLACASYANLIAAAATAGHLVAWETGRLCRGLAVMAAIGLSSVLGPVLLWYAASQSLAAGTAILAMLVALQTWRVRTRWYWMWLALVAAAAAPLFWTAGYTAGLVGLAYLWSDGRRFCRLASVAPLAASFMTAAAVWQFAGPATAQSSPVAQSAAPHLTQLPLVLTHVAQAISEKLILNNLGQDAFTAPAQAVVLCAGLLAIWAWTRTPRAPHGLSPLPRPNSLEAVGVVLVLANFALVFAARGRFMTYENLRALGWYDAIPQLGAVLFVSGWWSGLIDSPPPRSIKAPRPVELLGVAVFAAALLLVQWPRAQRVIFLYDGMATEVQLEEKPEDGPRHRTGSDLEGHARSQRQVLRALDSLERSIRDGNREPEAARRAIDQLRIPGMPSELPDFKTTDLLDLPPATGRAAESAGC
jgi:hypothetical protein